MKENQTIQKGIVIYYSYLETMEDLTNEEFGALMRSALEYAKTGSIPELKGNERILFKTIKYQIDQDLEKYKNKCDKNRENIEKRWKEIKKEEINTNVYDCIRPNKKNTKHTNINENENENENNKKEKNIKKEKSPLSNELDILPKGKNTIKKPTKSKKDLENDPLFLKFWEAYPKKANRPTAVKAYGKIKPMSHEVMDKILLGIERYQNSGLWSNKQFIPYPATFLNNRKWEDEVENLSSGVNRDGKPSYDIEGYQSFCRNNLMRPKSTDAFSETLDEQEKLEFIEVEVT